jgi:hypothetical protein
VRRLPLLALACLLLAGCAQPASSELARSRQPYCEYRGDPGTQFVVLMAQAVPSASQLPCIELLPAGWTVSDVFVRNGRARFALNSDRVGMHAVQVVLERTCQLGGAKVTRVPSDEPGTRRFERIGEVRPGIGFTGSRFYVFEGGCVTYQFQFNSSEERARLIGEVTLSLSFVTRDAMRGLIREATNGRADLDTSTDAGSR